MNMAELWCPYESSCLACESETAVYGPLTGFWHDLNCWSLRTALYNVWFRIQQAIQPDEEVE